MARSTRLPLRDCSGKQWWGGNGGDQRDDFKILQIIESHMIIGDFIFAATAGAFLLAGVLDRAFLQRGKVEITRLRKAKSERGYMRYIVEYTATSEPEWSELLYSFHDRNHPKTVITGKSRTLCGCKKGKNAEFLLIRQDLLTDGEWELSVKITSTSRRNPIYSLFPFVSRCTLAEEIKH
ncbi:MAG: hypothetical protein ACRC9V_13135, partial [Aeromonas sp.]